VVLEVVAKIDYRREYAYVGEQAGVGDGPCLGQDTPAA
jgi:hypothetical protein